MTRIALSIRHRCPALVLALLFAAVMPARAQTLTVTVGPSFPQGDMGERRTVGAHLAVSISPTVVRRGFLVRAEAGQIWHGTRGARNRALVPSGEREGLLSATSVMGYVLYSGAADPAIHLGMGLGAYQMRIRGNENPYGAVPGIGLVAGMTFGKRRVRGLVELQQQVIVSDFGNTEFSASTFVPVRFGASVNLR